MLDFNTVRALAITCSIGFAHTAWAITDTSQLAAVVESVVRPLLAEHDIPGMALAVTLDGESRYFNFGLASKKTNTIVTEDTLFEIGSVSKTFTATLAAYAEATGKLSLHDLPGKHIKPFKGAAIDKAKLVHLGTYTAGGLPLQFPHDVTEDDAMIRYFQNWKPVAAPGVQRKYSNPSIGLLGRIAAVALGASFADAVEEILFPQLGLYDSYVRVPKVAEANYAWGYDKAGSPTRVSPGMFDHEAYGIKTSASDLLRFVQANINPENLSAAMSQAVRRTQQGQFEVGYMIQGLGWEQYPYPVTLEHLLAGNSAQMMFEANPAKPLSLPPSPAHLLNKSGSTNGFGAYVAFIPQKRIGIIMLANKNFPVSARVKATYTILEHLAGPASSVSQATPPSADYSVEAAERK